MANPYSLPHGGGIGAFGGASSVRRIGGGGAGGGSVTNPWQPRFVETYESSKVTPYQQEWKSGVANAMALQNRDYEADLRRMAEEQVGKAYTQQGNQLGQIGMRELQIKGDVQDEWAKRRTDAQTRASIDAQGMKVNALEAARGMIGSASGVELQRLAQQLSAAEGGGGNYNQFQSMLIPLARESGAAGGPSPSGGGGLSGVERYRQRQALSSRYSTGGPGYMY